MRLFLSILVFLWLVIAAKAQPVCEPSSRWCYILQKYTPTNWVQGIFQPGSNVTFTTNGTTGVVTIAASGGGGSGAYIANTNGYGTNTTLLGTTTFSKIVLTNSSAPADARLWEINTSGTNSLVINRLNDDGSYKSGVIEIYNSENYSITYGTWDVTGDGYTDGTHTIGTFLRLNYDAAYGDTGVRNFLSSDENGYVYSTPIKWDYTNDRVVSDRGLLLEDLTASRLVATDGSKILTSTISAANLASSVTGTLPASLLGSGSGGSTKFLREDSTWQTVSAAPGGSDKQFQFNDSSSFGGATELIREGAGDLRITNSTLRFITNGTANTVPGGIILTNGTVASSGNQMYSPPIWWIGNGWKTTATAASQPVSFGAWTVPVQGAANPTANWVLNASTNNGTPSAVLTVSSAGAVNTASSITSGSQIFALTRLNITGKIGIASFLDGEPIIYNSVDSRIARLQVDVPVTAQTGNVTLAATDSGRIYNNVGASGSVTFTLPTAAVGQWFGFYVDASQNIVVDAAGTDTIRNVGSVTSAGGTITCGTQGSYVEIFCVAAGKWAVRTVQGTWTFA